jgi:hypothetical protein
MAEDPEIKAMGAVASALTGLDDDEARIRVLSWAATRFAPSVRISGAAGGKTVVESEDEAEETETPEFTAFVDLFDAAQPRTEPERALVGAYWYQVIEGAPDFPSMTVNNALKDVGHGVSNITDALAALQKRRPAQIRQVAKSGRNRQARKKYKLTTAGVAEVKRLLGEGGGGS